MFLFVLFGALLFGICLSLTTAMQVAGMLAAAFALNFGLQIAANTAMRRAGSDPAIGGAVALMEDVDLVDATDPTWRELVTNAIDPSAAED